LISQFTSWSQTGARRRCRFQVPQLLDGFTRATKMST